MIAAVSVVAGLAAFFGLALGFAAVRFRQEEDPVVERIDLLDREPKPLDPERGVEKPRTVAVIREDLCIGCTLCIQACPVDAILGAGKQMHTVIEAECTGCELCVEPCPVDCIDMVEEPVTIRTWKWPRPAQAPRTAEG